MADDDLEGKSPLIDMARGVYKKANDWISKIPTPGYKPDQQSDHDKAVADMNKKLNDQRVADANKTYVTQTAAQKKSTPAPTGKIITQKSGPRKKM